MYGFIVCLLQQHSLIASHPPLPPFPFPTAPSQEDVGFPAGRGPVREDVRAPLVICYPLVMTNIADIAIENDHL